MPRNGNKELRALHRLLRRVDVARTPIRTAGLGDTAADDDVASTRGDRVLARMVAHWRDPPSGVSRVAAWLLHGRAVRTFSGGRFTSRYTRWSWLSAHMMQHFLFMSAAPPLLLLGAPQVPLLRGLPRVFVRLVLGPLFRMHWLRQFVHSITGLKPAWFLMNLAYIGWHAPAAMSWLSDQRTGTTLSIFAFCLQAFSSGGRSPVPGLHLPNPRACWLFPTCCARIW